MHASNVVNVERIMKRGYGRSGFGAPANGTCGSRRARRSLKKDVDAFLDRNVFVNPLCDTEDEPVSHYVESDEDYAEYLRRTEESDYFDDLDEVLSAEEDAEPETDEGSCYGDEDYGWYPEFDEPCDVLTDAERNPVMEITL